MNAIPLQDAQARLPLLIQSLANGEEFTITENGAPLAQVKKTSTPSRPKRKAGSAKGKLRILVEDDEHLKHFAEYMG